MLHGTPPQEREPPFSKIAAMRSPAAPSLQTICKQAFTPIGNGLLTFSCSMAQSSIEHRQTAIMKVQQTINVVT